MRRALIALLLMVPPAALAQLVGTSVTVDDGSGDQTDPHVSCNQVAYTSQADFATEVRTFDFSSGAITAIPGGGRDRLADVNDDTVVFTRTLDDRIGVFAYDVHSGAIDELAPLVGSFRSNPSIGGPTVAFEDRGPVSAPFASQEIVIVRDGVLTRITDDLARDAWPALDPQGNVLVFTSCPPSGGCDVFQSVYANGSWATTAVTTGGAVLPNTPADTNGEVVVYSAQGDADLDLFWHPIDGGAVQQLSLEGDQLRPTVAGNLVAFESVPADGTHAEIFLYDLETTELYQLTDTEDVDEQLTDVSLCGTSATVVWAAEGTDGNKDVFGLEMSTAGEACEPVDPVVDDGSEWEEKWERWREKWRDRFADGDDDDDHRGRGHDDDDDDDDDDKGKGDKHGDDDSDEDGGLLAGDLPPASASIGGGSDATLDWSACDEVTDRALLSEMTLVVGKAAALAFNRFQATPGDGLLCVETDSAATFITLNDRLRAGPSNVAGEGTFAREVPLEEQNHSLGLVLGKPESRMRARIYGPAGDACAESSGVTTVDGSFRPGGQLMAGQRVAPIAIAIPELPEPPTVPQALGCSSSAEGSASALGLLLALLACAGFVRRREPSRARATVRRTR